MTRWENWHEIFLKNETTENGFFPDLRFRFSGKALKQNHLNLNKFYWNASLTLICLNQEALKTYFFWFDLKLDKHFIVFAAKNIIWIKILKRNTVALHLSEYFNVIEFLICQPSQYNMHSVLTKPNKFWANNLIPLSILSYSFHCFNLLQNCVWNGKGRGYNNTWHTRVLQFELA